MLFTFRKGRVRSRTTGMLLTAAAVVGLAVAAMVGFEVFRGAPSAAPAVPSVTLVSTAGTTLESEIVLPESSLELLTQASEANGQLVWISADGSGEARLSERDLTPRTRHGDEVMPPAQRKVRIAEDLDAFIEELNAVDSSGGRDVLAGLQKVPAGTGPVLLVTSGLQTSDPLDFATMGFDVDPAGVAGFLAEHGELPALQGRDVTWLVVPTTGDSHHRPHHINTHARVSD